MLLSRCALYLNSRAALFEIRLMPNGEGKHERSSMFCREILEDKRVCVIVWQIMLKKICSKETHTRCLE